MRGKVTVNQETVLVLNDGQPVRLEGCGDSAMITLGVAQAYFGQRLRAIGLKQPINGRPGWWSVNVECE